MSYLSDADCGDLIFSALQQHGPMSQADIRAVTGLNGSAFRRGIDYIRDTLADTQGEVYTYDPHTNTYVLATQQDEALRYCLRRQHSIRVQQQRVNTGTVYPAVARWGGPAWQTVQHNADQMANSLQFAESMLEQAVTTP